MSSCERKRRGRCYTHLDRVDNTGSNHVFVGSCSSVETCVEVGAVPARRGKSQFSAGGMQMTDPRPTPHFFCDCLNEASKKERGERDSENFESKSVL
jgi:hypothetical protein